VEGKWLNFLEHLQIPLWTMIASFLTPSSILSTKNSLGKSGVINCLMEDDNRLVKYYYWCLCQGIFYWNFVTKIKWRTLSHCCCRPRLTPRQKVPKMSDSPPPPVLPFNRFPYKLLIKMLSKIVSLNRHACSLWCWLCISSAVNVEGTCSCFLLFIALEE